MQSLGEQSIAERAPGSRRESASSMPACARSPSPPCKLVDADLGWRELLESFGISAAIISFARSGGDVGRQSFIVGMDEARTNPSLARALIEYAESIWLSRKSSTFHSLRISWDEHNDDVAPFVLPIDVGAAVPPPLARATRLAILRHAEGGAHMQVLLIRASDEGDFTPECRKSITRALPLLLRSAGNYVGAKREQRRTAQLEAMFDKVSLSTLLVDADSRLVFGNDAARAMLNDQSWLMQNPDSTIACRNAGLTRQLRNAVRGVATIGDFATADIVLRLENDAGEWRLAFVVPAASRFRDESWRGAMILVHSGTRSSASAEMLGALGLLPSEQRFLNSFLKTNSLNEAARECRVSDQTARTYLKRVRAKLGVHRQMDLAGLISGLVPPIKPRALATAR